MASSTPFRSAAVNGSSKYLRVPACLVYPVTVLPASDDGRRPRFSLPAAQPMSAPQPFSGSPTQDAEGPAFWASLHMTRRCPLGRLPATRRMMSQARGGEC
jgi:hypothetical protein